MKKILSIFLIITILISCNSQKAFSEFDYSYSKSESAVSRYENLLIKGNNVLYSLESKDKKTKKKFKISDTELQNIEKVLSENQFRKILEENDSQAFDKKPKI